MNFIKEIKENAVKKAKKLILPEGFEPRTIEAAGVILKEKIAKEVSLVGEISKIEEVAKANNLSLEGITIVDPSKSENLQNYSDAYYELRKAKGMTSEQAKVDMQHFLRWGCMAVRLGDADAVVAGAHSTTGDVLKAGFTILKTAPGVKFGSSCFIMVTNQKDMGHNGMFIFSDCATIINPTSEQLSEIALGAAQSCKDFLQADPKIAFLSFSTMGSAKSEETEKVVQAVKLLKEKSPNLLAEGELQLDAAIIPQVAKSKAPNSQVAGHANVLIFPSLEAGNIGYKLVQRFANADAIGPVLQGFAYPISDLSRGCSVADIVNTSALTICQAK